MADRNVKVILSLIADGFTRGAKQAADAVDGLEGKLVKNEQALNTVSATALTAGGALLAGVGLAAKGYADFDKQMSAVKATGIGVGAEFDALREKAIELGASTSFSASEAAQGIEELAKAGLSASDILDGGLAGALDLAAAGSISVAEAAETTAVTLQQFALDGSQAAHVADLLAAGANEAVGGVSDIGAALNMSGTVAAQFGISIEETVGTLAMFASNSLIGSDAGTSFKQMLLQLVQPTGKARELLDEYNISAYDAQGNFVGMESLAGQLKTQLGNLSQEQQNAALKTIFGADAIRTATVLMNEGAEGVRKWTDAVNQQGYASEMAQMKLDNLSGDLEELGGAFESLFIRSGSGMNDFLRVITQGATGLVNAIGNLPGPVLGVSAALAGISGAGLLAAGGFIKVVQTGAELKGAIGTLRESFPKLDAAMGKVGWKKAALGAAALTGALIAQQVAASANAAAFDRLIVNADDLAAKLQKSGDAGKTLNEAFTLETQGLFSGVTKEVDGLGDALQRVLRADPGQQFEDMFNSMFTGGDAASQMRKQFAELDQTLSGMVGSGSAPQASALFDRITEAAKAQGIPLEELATLFPQYADALRNAAGNSGAAKTNMDLLASGLGEVRDEAVDARGSLIDLGNAMLGLSGSQIGYEAALDDATAAIKEHGKAALDASGMIDIGSEKGRALKQSLDGVAGSALSVIDNMTKTGQSTQAVADFQARAATDFLKAADAMGVGSEAAIQMAADYGLIPQEVATQISAPGANLTEQQIKDVISATAKVPSLTEAKMTAPGARPSKAEVDAFISSVGKVPGLTEAKIRTIADLYGVEVARRAINSVQGKTVQVTVNYRSSGVSLSRVASAYASGGPIVGPGTGTSDSILALVSNGEYVIRAASVAKLGLERLDWLNRFGELPRFATGGQVASAPVRYAPNYSPPSYASSVVQAAQPVTVQMPSVMELRDVDGALIGRMRVEARGAVIETARTGMRL